MKKVIYAVLALLAFTLYSYAQSSPIGVSYGGLKVKKITVAHDGFFVGFNVAPNGCDKYGFHGRVPATASAYKELLAAFLSAKTSGSTITIWRDNAANCSSWEQIPRIHAIRIDD